MIEPRDVVDTIVAETIQVRPDLDATAVELLTRLTRIGRLVEARTRRSLDPFGLRIGGFWLLVALRRSGPPFRLTSADLLAHATVTPGAISQQLDRLERQGLLLRSTHPDDARAVIVELTAAGLDLIDGAWTAHIHADAVIFEDLSKDQKEGLIRALRVVEAAAIADRSVGSRP